MPLAVKVQPSLEAIKGVLAQFADHKSAPNIVPVYAPIPADLLTPSLAYMKLSRCESDYSFLFESAETTETIGRYSYVGVAPRKVIKTGPGHGPAADPMPILADELSKYREAVLPGVVMPPMAGGAVGYVGYDCVQYFEPKTARPLKDVMKVPEALFMMFDTLVAFDHFYQTIRVISYMHIPPNAADFEDAYNRAVSTVRSNTQTLLGPEIPLPAQQPINLEQKFTSNIGQTGYESFVERLKGHIGRGDIIQCVPSQRLSRPTSLHPFNIYRHLRTVNPSPYLFYLSCADFSIVGASPELLVRSNPRDNTIITHPIAGTVKRNLADPIADEKLADTLRDSLKDRAEHVMLVDLARNDVNRVCDPRSTKVERLMVVEKFSHVQHLVSEVTGVLRPGKTRFDAFRSIFPAGTVSGAPKVRAMELIAELEGEKRGIYAGAVGYWGYDSVTIENPVTTNGENREDQNSKSSSAHVRVRQGAMDTCIALRTMMIKEGVAYLQAGGGIVFDSDPYEEWQETINKLGANQQCIKTAEEWYAGRDHDA